jgi:trk system potassium uptake protein TrkH
MRAPPRMIRALGWCWLIVGSAAMVFLALAVALGEAAAARGLGLTGVIGVFIGAVIVVSTRGADRPARAPAALRLALLGWITCPLLAAPSLAPLAGGLQEGVFEAYSAMTTTGASLADPDGAPRSLVLWRAALQWLGGFASLVLAVTVFAALDQRGAGIRRSTLLTVQDNNLFTNLGRTSRRLGGLYALLTLFGVVLLMVTGAELFDALCLAMSGISTGGMSPRGEPLAAWLPAPGILALALICLTGAWNFALIYEMITRRRLSRSASDLRAMLALCLMTGVAAGLAGGAAWTGPVSALEALFAVTTSGFQIGEGGPILPPAVLILLALLGGSAVSTAGGIKMPRVILLVRRAGEELSHLAHPSAAVFTRFAGRKASDEALVSVWVYALAFPVALGVGTAVLGACGLDFETAWQVAGASLSNAGPLAQVDYAAMPGAAWMAASAIMVLGRLEVLAAAAAIFVLLKGE